MAHLRDMPRVPRIFSAALLFHVTFILLNAQPVLLPSIGIGALPGDTDAICTLPFQTPPLQNNGLFTGETAADFKLFGVQGNAFELSEALLEKPVLLIAGSYTCPVFRNKLPLINSIQATFGDQLTTVIIYTAEAHPHLDISPYHGAVNTHQANFNEEILYQQPTTYGERVQVAMEMLEVMTIDVPVLIDGPCNEWWEFFGPAPNNAYLISMDGTIFSRHTWLDKHPQDILCDIHDLLGKPIDCEQTFGGTFSMEWLTNDTVTGPAGTTLTVSTRIINTSDTPVLVEVHRLLNDLPQDWASAICLDVCYQSHVEFAQVVVPAGGHQDHHFYFYAGSDAGHGHARVGVRNADDHTNGFMMNFHAFSEVETSIPEMGHLPLLSVWPLPAEDLLYLGSELLFDRITILDLTGRTVLSMGASSTVDISTLASGMHLLQAWLGAEPVSRPVRAQKL